MNRVVFHSLLIVLIAGFAPPPATAVTIETVPVGDPGNAPDPEVPFHGAVGYEYRIGTYEVTNAQYAEFLNAKAAGDPLELYDTDMGISTYGGIARSSSSGSYTYAVKPNMGNKPVHSVTYWDAVRFVNWLHNGQGSGDTETGSYTLLGGTPTPSNNATDARTRNPGATWVLPSENEWYKAAYYDPRSETDGGPPGDDNYWLYPTSSDTAPTLATANSVGDISNPGLNVANYAGGADWNGSSSGNVTTVETAGLLSESYYGTSDQAGNAWEWSDTLIGTPLILGGTYDPVIGAIFLTPSGEAAAVAAGVSFERSDRFIGFRVALVPEPGSLLLAALGFAGLVAWRWRRRPRRADGFSGVVS